MAFQTFPQEKIAQEQFLGGISTGATGRRPSVGATEEQETQGKIWRQGGAWLRHPFTRLGPPDRARPRPAAASPWRRDEDCPSRPTPHRLLPTRESDGLVSCPLLLSPSDSCLLLPYFLLPSLNSPFPFLLLLIYIVLRPCPFPCPSYPSGLGASGWLMDLRAQR